MTCAQRPTEITCACGAKRRVRAKGIIPTQCVKCAELQYVRDYRKKLKEAPDTIRHLEDSRELGPERPLLGWTKSELRAYKCKRAVQLYLDEGLASVLIAERLGVDDNFVSDALRKAGVAVVHRDRLPAGVPS